jgi:low temperature requirement protein LtrA
VSHLPERFGLFTILVLGESLLAITAGLHEAHQTFNSIVAAAGALLVATGLWWLYFDNLEGSVVRRDATRKHDWRPTAWIYAHMPLAMCLILNANGLEHVIAAARGDHPGEYDALPAVATAGALAALGLILIASAGRLEAGRNRRRAAIRLVGAALAIVLVLPAGDWSPPAYALALGSLLASMVVADLVEAARWPDVARGVTPGLAP